MKIKRDFYLDRLIKAKGDGFVKILTGIRRCGKSYLLFTLFKEHLLKDGVRRENIVEIALDKKKKAACFASNLTFADGAVFEITDAENLETYKDEKRAVALTVGSTISRLPSVRFTTSAGTPATVNGSWSLRLSADGKSLKFGRDKGTMIIIE